MKVLIVLIATCVAGSFGQDCSTKFKAYHQCLEDNHKQAEQAGKAKFQDLKPKLDACYTSNGCTPPAKSTPGEPHRGGGHGHNGNNTQAGTCRKAVHEAMRQKFEACVKQSIPSFTFPPKDGKQEKPHREGGHEGFNHREDNKALDNCAKKQTVRDCKRALLNSTRPTDAEKKARFQARCDGKQKCQVALGSDCQAQLEKFESVACQCRQQDHQQEEQVRADTPACQGVQDRKGTRAPRPQRECDRKDYCKLGYDAFVQDHPKGQGKGGHH